jgi:hypothetical protein
MVLKASETVPRRFSRGLGCTRDLRGAERRGRVAGEDYGLHTTLFLEKSGERATFKAREETELLHFRLPNLTDVKAAMPYAPAQAAAE